MPRNPAKRVDHDPGHVPAYVRWTPAEYLAVAVNALPFIEQKYPTLDAFMKAQRVALPRERWRKAESISSQQVVTMREYEAKARALAPQARAALLKLAEPVKPITPGAANVAKARAAMAKKRAENPDLKTKGPVRWLTREKALVAREYKRVKDEYKRFSQGVGAAMRAVLPEDRWMSQGSLWTSCRSGMMQKHLDEGARNEWLLKEQEEATAADAEPAELPEEITGSDAATLQRAQEGQAPQVPPRAHSAFADASSAFAATLADAVGLLLQAHAAHLQQTLEARIGGIAQDVGLAIAAQIERGLRQTVVDTMAAELGGPVKAPAAAPAAPLPPVQAEPAKRVRFDVVGFEQGAHEQAVVRGLNGLGGKVELHFVHPDKFTAYAPHKGRHVIFVAERVSHTLREKIKAAGVTPTYVKRTPGHVVHAIEAICDAQGVAH